MRRARTRQCSCANPTDEREPSGHVCCEHCEEPPCQFVATFDQCRIFSKITDAYPNAEHIKDSGYLYLLKSCIRGCTWTAKWMAIGACGSFPESYASPGCWQPIEVNSPLLECCWWGDTTNGADATACDGDVLDNPDASGDLPWDMWTLEITGPTTATLTVTPKTGGSATYTCDTFDCAARNNFKFDAAGATDNLSFMPCGVCVAPVNTAAEPPLRCATKEDQCACCDNLEQFALNLVVVGCDGTTLQPVQVGRRDSADDLECGPRERYPSAAPCGVWWFVFGLGDSGCDFSSEAEGWDGQAGLMLWCDPSDEDQPYRGEVYCHNVFLDCWVYNGDVIISTDQCCPELRVSFNFPELPCCCEGGDSGCACDDLNDDLTAEFQYAGGGGTAATITISRSGGDTWTGSGNVGEIPFTFTLTCEADGIGGDENAGPTMTATIDCGGGPITVTQTFSGCNPFEWQGSFAGCDMESVTVTE